MRKRNSSTRDGYTRRLLSACLSPKGRSLPWVDFGGRSHHDRAALELIVLLFRDRDSELVLAFTKPGLRVVHVCGKKLRHTFLEDRRLAEVIVIHELLHGFGLAENPPSSQAVTPRDPTMRAVTDRSHRYLSDEVRKLDTFRLVDRSTEGQKGQSTARRDKAGAKVPARRIHTCTDRPDIRPH
jgi:hypothetical protein